MGACRHSGHCQCRSYGNALEEAAAGWQLLQVEWAVNNFVAVAHLWSSKGLLLAARALHVLFRAHQTGGPCKFHAEVR